MTTKFDPHLISEARSLHGQLGSIDSMVSPDAFFAELCARKRERRAYLAGGIATLILAASAFFSGPAAAKELAYMPNQAGGEIVLTTDKIKSCDGNRLAFSRTNAGDVITGCWFAEGHYVTIRWSESGNLKVFLISNFQLFEEPVEPHPTADQQVSYR